MNDSNVETDLNLQNLHDESQLRYADPLADHTITEFVKQEIDSRTLGFPDLCLIQACPLSSDQVRSPNKRNVSNKKCNFTALKVSKSGRKFDLIVDGDTSSDKKTLCIIAGYSNNPAKVTFELLNPVGPCDKIHGKKHSFDSGGNSLKILPESHENKLIAELVSDPKIKIFPRDAIIRKYIVTGNRCGHSDASAIVAVYPDTEIEVFIGLDFGEKSFRTDEKVDVRMKKYAKTHNTKKKAKQKTTTCQVKTIKISKGLVIGGSIKYDNREHDFEIACKKSIETVKKFNEIVRNAHNALSKIKGEIIAAEISQVFDNPIAFGIKLPVLKLNLSGSWQEDKGKPTVSFEGKVKIEGDPAFGMGFEWNITSTLLQSFPGGIAALKIKKKLAEGFLDLIIKADGIISGNIEVKIKNREIENCSGLLEGKIPILAEFTFYKGNLSSVPFVHATIEYKIAIESGFKLQITYDNKEKVLKGTGGFLDFVVWCSGSIDTGGCVEDSESNSCTTMTKGTDKTVEKESKEVELTLYKKKFDEFELFKYDFLDQ